ncbi:CgeB family protein [Salinivibrio sharmensis]|uniref:UDP-N-acetylglucosamine 2-epimerase domain-containing protein n=1 Tax=Salinivibrio sharmensis TaxID=390883 RepID=A0ABX3K9A6_9GAMM|nr:hypothetical protein [Salinivibrio sharmensis]OOE85046.1 hypothetical protein BZG74_14395 [Salinivibrio sharmensis]
MKKIIQTLEILEREPEQWMSYLHGQKYEELSHLQERPRLKGKILRFISLYYNSMRNIQLFKQKPQENYDFLFLAGTQNQKSALMGLMSSLKSYKKSFVCIVPENKIEKKDLHTGYFNPLKFTFRDIISSFALNVMRYKNISRAFSERNHKILLDKLDKFLSVHLYLFYFNRVVEEISPSYVIVSNDHNTMNRALIAVARYKGIKTVYLQHASVSNIFPALNFDYSFLDGMSAVEIYQECENNRPPALLIKKNQEIFLSGQKKAISKIDRCDRELIGIAPNALDKDEDVKLLANHLIQKGYKPLLRWHPGLGKRKIEKLKSVLGSMVTFSDPKLDSLNEFFNQTLSVIAGNSSILLEAALAGLTPIYYQITKSPLEDYYGYVEKGISIKCNYLNEIEPCISKINAGKLNIKRESIRYFSSTYDTEWFGKEGELVASILMSISCSEKPLIESISLDSENAGNTTASK